MGIKRGERKIIHTLASIKSISIVVDTEGIWTGQKFTTSFQASLPH